MEENELGFELARPIENDADLVMRWRNDPQTLRMSMHTKPKVWPIFYPEFLSHYFTLPDLPPLFILQKGQRVGFLYFEAIEHPEQQHNRRCAEISINISPDCRGQGIGTQALTFIKAYAQRQGYDDLFARIKPDNKTSQKSFAKAGFERLNDITAFIESTGEKIPIHCYIARLTEHNKQHVFIIAEAGSNWRMGTLEKDLAASKKLIEVAKEAGADAIKFQVFRPETIYVPNAGKSGYLSEVGIEKDMHDIFADLSMPYEMIPLLANHCKKIGIEFMATAFSKSDFLAIDPYVKRHKIASYEIGHIRLIELIAKTKKHTFISTGAATESEIEWAVETFKKNQGGNLTLLQCTAKYPAEPESMNLRTIPWLKNRFLCEVGLSDHSNDPLTAPICAAALGAIAIEKHFTLDSKLPGPDHAFALEPDELKAMVSAIRQTEQMLGSWTKYVHPSEDELRAFAKRGLQAIKDINPGDILQEGFNIDILRPGVQSIGIHPKYIEKIEGKKAKRFIPLGTGIQIGDWE